MKKIFYVLLFIFTFSLFGCKKKDKEYDYSKYECVKLDTDRVINWTIDDIKNGCDLIIVGEIKGNFKQTIQKEDNKFIYGYTTCEAEVVEVIKGTYTKNTITLENMYCVLEDENTFVTFSDLKPFEKGDKFIYCLKKDESRNAYCIYGDYSAIFPYNYDKASSITSIYNEITDYLSNKSTINESEIDSYKDTHIIYRSVKNKIYVLTNDEAFELKVITSKFGNLKKEMNIKDFGLNNFEYYDLALYAEFISEFIQ